MTDRHAGYVITLERDMREDDAERTIEVLRHIVGVVSVEPVVAAPELHIAEARADAKWRDRIIGLLRMTEI